MRCFQKIPMICIFRQNQEKKLFTPLNPTALCKVGFYQGGHHLDMLSWWNAPAYPSLLIRSLQWPYFIGKIFLPFYRECNFSDFLFRSHLHVWVKGKEFASWGDTSFLKWKSLFFQYESNDILDFLSVTSIFIPLKASSDHWESIQRTARIDKTVQAVWIICGHVCKTQFCMK